MLNKEELDSWNELFPDCSIRESDLSHPTEPFLTKTLIAYLQTFGYKVTPPFALNADAAAEISREKRLFQIKLTCNIDHILKITDKSYAFLYMDLIRPSPKKTAHMLRILLNYLYYFNLFKTDVFGEAGARLRTRQELQQDIAKAQLENTQRSEYAEKLNAKIDALSVQVPAAKAEVKALAALIAEQQEQLQAERDTNERQGAEREELEDRKRNLKQQIVPDSETRELQTKVQKLQQSIAEQNQDKCAAELQLKDFMAHINALHALLQQISQAHQIVSPQLLENFKENQLRLKEARKRAQDLEQKKTNLLQTIEKQEQSLKACEEQLQQATTEFELEKRSKQQVSTDRNQHCLSMEEQCAILLSQEHAVECLVEQKKDIDRYLHEGFDVLMLNN